MKAFIKWEGDGHTVDISLERLCKELKIELDQEKVDIAIRKILHGS